MKKITVALLKDLESQVAKGEISYSRMVEILNEQYLEHTEASVQSEANEIEVKELRDRFFKECTNKADMKFSEGVFIPNVIMHPHNLFEWFKPYLHPVSSVPLSESTKEKIEEMIQIEYNRVYSETNPGQPYPTLPESWVIDFFTGQSSLSSPSPVKYENKG